MTVRDAVLDGGEPSGGRAQSELLGVVLLLGLVAAGAISIMIVAGGAISDTQAQAEQERIEQSFVELSHAMASATANGDMPKEIDFEAGKHGAITKTDAGTITIEGGNVSEELTVGAIEYEHDDGSIVAYQAGGVWAERGNETRMLSAPPVSYDATDETLMLPLTDMSERKDLSTGTITISSIQTDPVKSATHVEDDTINVTIESPYYRGWEQYFLTQGGDGTIREVDHENQTVKAKFGFHEIDGAFDTGATIGSPDPDHFHDQQDNIGEDHTRGTLMPEMDPVIEEMIEDAKDGDVDENLSPGTYTDADTLENGTYYVSEIGADEQYHFDLTNGDATLIVEDDIDLDNSSILVTDRNDGNVLRIYTGGDKLTLDGDICVEGCDGDATAIQLYGKSTMAVDLGPGAGGTFEGLLYAASSEEKDWWAGESTEACDDHHQVHEQAGDASFTGSLVAYSVCAHSNGMEFSYDEDLKDLELEAYPEEYELPPQITYLNIAIYEMDIENN